MNNQNIYKLISIVVVLVLSLLQVAAQEKANGENYSAILEVTRGPARAPLNTINRVYIYIDRFSSDEDVAQLAGLLKEKGTKALLEAMYKRDDGRISTGRCC